MYARLRAVPSHWRHRGVPHCSHRYYQLGSFHIVLHKREWVIIVNMLLIGSNGLIATYFFGAFSASRDSLIKVGSLIAGIGLGFNVLISILQMAGVYVFVLALLGALVMMAGVVIACIKFIMLFQRDAFVVVFCVFIFLGLLLSLFWTWASLISGAGLGGLLIYFYVHNITY